MEKPNIWWIQNKYLPKYRGNDGKTQSQIWLGYTRGQAGSACGKVEHTTINTPFQPVDNSVKSWVKQGKKFFNNMVSNTLLWAIRGSVPGRVAGAR